MFRNLKLENSPLYSRKLYPSIGGRWLLSHSPTTISYFSWSLEQYLLKYLQYPLFLQKKMKMALLQTDSDSQQSPITDSLQSASNAPNIPPPTIEITSLQEGERVPVGELTIEGVSSDDQESDCQVLHRRK